MKQTHTRPGETATGCVSKVLSLQITLSRPACWMASNFNWIRTRAKKFSTTRQQPRQTIQITRIDSASKKKKKPSPKRSRFPRKRVYSRGSRAHGFPRYSHTTDAKVSESIIFVHNAYRTGSGRSNLPHLPRGLASLRGREGSPSTPLSISLSLSPSQVFRVILFFVCDSIAPPLPPLSLLPVTPSALLLSRSPSPLIFSRGRILAPKRMTREDRALPRWNRAGAGEEHANTPST